MLPVILVATFMAQFDLYVVNVALPVLRQDLGAGPVALELVVGGYAFAYASGLITGGRLGDLYGHRLMYALSMLGFGLASAACGAAGSGEQLVTCRMIQGLTAAVMVPQVLALISSSFPPTERGHALSWFGVVIEVGAIAGQVVGGLLLQADVLGLGWRPIFLVNVPVALAAVALAGRFLPAHDRGGQARLDVTGAAGVTAALALVLIPLTLGRQAGWPWWCYAMLAVAGLALPLLLTYENRLARRGGSPVLPPALFSQTAFNLGLALSVTIFAAFFSLVFCMTLVLQDGLGLTPMRAGLAFAPLGICFATASIGARGLVRRHGAKTIAAGTIIANLAIATIAILAGSDPDALTVPRLIIPLAVVGLGNGTAIPAIIGQVLTRIRPDEAGAASGALTTAQQFASALGIAAIAGIFFTTLGTGTPDLTAHGRALAVAASVDTALMAGAGALAIALLRTHRKDTP